jgi:midasin
MVFFCRAVKKGDWLLVEDIDLAPSDVMSTLMPLIERGELYLPSKGEIIESKPGCAMSY